MTSKDLYLGLENIDPAMIEAAAPVKGKKINKRRILTKWVSISVCMFIAFTASLIMALSGLFSATPIEHPNGSDSPPDGGIGGVQIPDKVYTFNKNERMNCSCGECYAIFEHLYLTSTIDNITASEGGYLIFVATVYTDHHWFDTNGIILDTELIDDGDFSFSEILSEQLSDTKNAFDPKTTCLNGKMCFVFTLDANAYNKLFTAIKNDALIYSFTLSPYISWCGGSCLFTFAGDSIEIITKYNKRT